MGRLEPALQELGASRVEAALLATLLPGRAKETAAILKATGLRQPEVSMGIAKFRARGWVSIEPVPRKGKGRPMHKYQLAVSKGDIQQHYQSQGKATVARIDAALKELAKATS